MPRYGLACGNKLHLHHHKHYQVVSRYGLACGNKLHLHHHKHNQVVPRYGLACGNNTFIITSIIRWCPGTVWPVATSYTFIITSTIRWCPGTVWPVATSYTFSITSTIRWCPGTVWPVATTPPASQAHSGGAQVQFGLWQQHLKHHKHNQVVPRYDLACGNNTLNITSIIRWCPGTIWPVATTPSASQAQSGGIQVQFSLWQQHFKHHKHNQVVSRYGLTCGNNTFSITSTIRWCPRHQQPIITHKHAALPDQPPKHHIKFHLN